ncbi:MAG: hypothetical protein ACOC38_01430 [Promethearchaeia archaeon]
MSEDKKSRIIEKSKKDANRQSAGSNLLRQARELESSGDNSKAKELFVEAARAYVESATEYRSSKGYKNAARNSSEAGDVYSHLADVSEAMSAYESAADDLYSAASEHLMWDEASETKNGTALAMTSCLMYLMIGKEDKAFKKSSEFQNQYGSKLNFPAVQRLSGLIGKLQQSIANVNIEAFSQAETMAISELKPALSSAKASYFKKYVDKGLEMVREILRGKLQTPKLTGRLQLPIDMTFSEELELLALVSNVGEGAAQNVNVQWYLDDNLELVSGESRKQFPTIDAGDSVELRIIAMADEELMGERDYEILLRGSYSDQLKTEYSLQIGPGILTLKDYKESEKIAQDLDITEGRIGLLTASLEQFPFAREPLDEIVQQLKISLRKAKEKLESGNLETAKARVKVVNELINHMDNLFADEDLKTLLRRKRREEKRKAVSSAITSLKGQVLDIVEKHISDIDTKLVPAVNRMQDLTSSSGTGQVLDSMTRQIQRLSTKLREILSVVRALPQKDPAKLREDSNAAIDKIDSVLSEIEVVKAQLDKVLESQKEATEETRSDADTVERRLAEIRSMKTEILNAFEQDIDLLSD